jgi:hypothetical protein
MIIRWKRLGGYLLFYAPLFFITVMSVNLGLSMSFAGWVELNVLNSKIETTSNSPLDLSLTYLSLINECVLVIATGLILTQIGIFTFWFFAPKVSGWIDSKFPKEKETNE